MLLDDLQFFIGKRRTLEELLHTIDTLQAAGAQIVVAADRSPAELNELGGELTSRIAAGVSVGIDAADETLRRRLLDRLCDAAELDVDPGVLDIVATGIAGGAREMQGVLNRLRVTHDLLGAPIDEALARRVVADTNRQTTPRVQMADIQGAVCRVFGIDKQSLKSNKRTKAATEPRMLAMWLSRKYTQAAWSEIGEYYGRRSHSTVISACRRVEQMIGRTHAPTGAGDRLQDALRQVEAELRTA